MTAIFPHLFVLGRPAGGKSEFIDFMKKLAPEDRAARFGIGRFEEVDDFPWLFEACVEDDAREARGEARLVSEKVPEGYNITRPKFRGSLVDRFNETIRSRYLARPEFYRDGTLLIEFARGRDDGFRESLGRFDGEILRRAAILYIKVSFEESYRRNDARYRRGQEESILFHKVPDRDMYGFFRDNDWDDLTGGAECGWIEIARSEVRGPRSEVEFTKSGVGSPESGVGVRAQHAVPVPTVVRVPFVSMNNEPESTDPVVLGDRYGRALGRLRELVAGAALR